MDSVAGYDAIAVSGVGRVPVESEVSGARLYDKVLWWTSGYCGNNKDKWYSLSTTQRGPSLAMELVYCNTSFGSGNEMTEAVLI